MRVVWRYSIACRPISSHCPRCWMESRTMIWRRVAWREGAADQLASIASRRSVAVRSGRNRLATWVCRFQPPGSHWSPAPTKSGLMCWWTTQGSPIAPMVGPSPLPFRIRGQTAAASKFMDTWLAHSGLELFESLRGNTGLPTVRHLIGPAAVLPSHAVWSVNSVRQAARTTTSALRQHAACHRPAPQTCRSPTPRGPRPAPTAA